MTRNKSNMGIEIGKQSQRVKSFIENIQNTFTQINNRSSNSNIWSVWMFNGFPSFIWKKQIDTLIL